MATLADNIELIELGPAGAEILVELHMMAFSTDTGERWSGADLSAVLVQPGSYCILAKLSGRPAGYALARMLAGECELLSLGVAGEMRRQGVASRLLERLFEICRTQDVTRLFLEVREDNWPARRFYIAKGFEQIGRRLAYYRRLTGGTSDAITMAVDFDRGQKRKS